MRGGAVLFHQIHF